MPCCNQDCDEGTKELKTRVYGSFIFLFTNKIVGMTFTMDQGSSEDENGHKQQRRRIRFIKFIRKHFDDLLLYQNRKIDVLVLSEVLISEEELCYKITGYQAMTE